MYKVKLKHYVLAKFINYRRKPIFIHKIRKEILK